MNQEARKAKAEYMREYMRQWRKNNADKVKQSQQKYWEKKFKEQRGEKNAETGR